MSILPLGIKGRDPDPLAEILVNQPISIVIPTIHEAENIPIILERLDTLRRRYGLTLEVLFMDDDSCDGSVELVETSGFDWAKIIVRTGDRDLSKAVIEGMRQARHPTLICMDCDLGHSPEEIPHLILALSTGRQMVVGSRYISGGITDDDWGLLRCLMSSVAALLARPLTSISDPMSGFFVLRKSDFDRAQDLNPIGYKVALELIVKCSFDNVSEVPIQFGNRLHGRNKLTLRERLLYIQHVRRLYLYKFSNSMYVLQFLVVGTIGTFVNLAVLTILSSLGAAKALALGGGIVTSLVSNFYLNRRFTFSYARQESIWRQFGAFVGASLIGMAVNYTIALALAAGPLSEVPFGLQFAAISGIAAGMMFNFLGNRYFVFRKTRHVRTRKDRN